MCSHYYIFYIAYSDTTTNLTNSDTTYNASVVNQFGKITSMMSRIYSTGCIKAIPLFSCLFSTICFV